MKVFALSLLLLLPSLHFTLATASADDPGSDARWVRLTPLVPRTSASLVYDASREILLLFGGMNDPGDAGVWFLSLRDEGRDWVALEPRGDLPTARYGHSAVLDRASDRMMVFGGRDQNSDGLLNEVWELRLQSEPEWSRVTPGGAAPSRRYAHAALLDPVGNRMIVFGGFDGSYLNDVWAFSLDGEPAWTRLLPEGEAPAPRSGMAAVYDSKSNSMIVCGGTNGQTVFGDVWGLSLGAVPRWTKLSDDGTPGRYGHVAALDVPMRELIVFGGYGGDGQPRNDVISLKLGTGSPRWRDISAGDGPAARAECAGAYVDRDRRVVIFGGTGDSKLGDTWALSLRGKPAWAMIEPESGFPSGAVTPSTIFDPVRDQMILYGGETGSVSQGETWSLSLGESPRWMQWTTNSGPGGRNAHTAVYDARRDRMLVFGGYRYAGGINFNDLWSLSLGDRRWSRIDAAGERPSPRDGHTAVLDPVRDEMLVFGGWAAHSSSYYNDLYVLEMKDGYRWRRLDPPGGGPDGRFQHSAFYDPASERMFIAGGYGVYIGGPHYGSYRHDVWALSLGDDPSWANLYLNDGSPDVAHSLYGSAYAFDAVRNRLVFFGGAFPYTGDVWTFPLDTNFWKRLTLPNAGPTPRFAASGIMDTDRDRMVIFGGRFGGREFPETWAVTWGSPPQLPEPVAGRSRRAEAAIPELRIDSDPADATVRLGYSLSAEGWVRLNVYDIQGRKVAQLVDERQSVGDHQASWNRAVHPLPSGIYFIRLASREGTTVRRLLMIR
jgi:hypothetical protein